MYDPTEDENHHDPFMSASDVFRLYHPSQAADSRTKLCDQGSGNWVHDD